MKGLFQYKTAGQQFFLLLSLSLFSFFVIGLLGTYALTIITGISLEQVGALDTIDPKHPPSQRRLPLRRLNPLPLRPLNLSASLPTKYGRA